MIIDELFESPQQCPECGGISFSNLILAEKKDACYHKVKASAKVWPSAYASGRLVQCRKKGAANYGNKSEGVAEVYNAITGALLSYDEKNKEQGVAEGGDVFMANIKNTPEYKAGFATGKLPVPHPEGTQEYANYYKGVIDKASPTLSKVGEDTLDEKSVSQAQFRTMAAAAHNPKFAKKVGISQDVAQEFNRADKKSNYKKLPDRATEGEQQKGADYRDPKEVNYDDEYDAMVSRVKKLAGLGPMKTVYDPAKRQYRNMPTAQQPKK